MKNYIIEIENTLKELKEQKIIINQSGFILNQFYIEKLTYTIKKDILKLLDDKKQIYISINLNQVYKVEIIKEKIILYLDNDTNITIEKY